jgi:hypothetical protein
MNEVERAGAMSPIANSGTNQMFKSHEAQLNKLLNAPKMPNLKKK